MAFSSTLLKRERVGNGNICEVYSWNGAAVTTGDITPDTTDAEGLGLIKTIDDFSVTDDANAVRAEYNTPTSRAALTLTFTSNDTGNATIIGKSV